MPARSAGVDVVKVVANSFAYKLNDIHGIEGFSPKANRFFIISFEMNKIKKRDFFLLLRGWMSVWESELSTLPYIHAKPFCAKTGNHSTKSRTSFFKKRFA